LLYREAAASAATEIAWVERIRIVYPRVELVRNGSRRVDGSFGAVSIDAGA